MSNPKYLKKIDTGECFAFSPWLMKRGDFVAWEGPLPFEKKEPKNELAGGPSSVILEAVKSIPEEEWGQAPGKLKAPKVGDVSKAAGFKVSAEEIQEAVKAIEE